MGLSEPLIWSTLDEAAQWLAAGTGAPWTARRVLSEAVRLTPEGGPVQVAFAPGTLTKTPLVDLQGVDTTKPTEAATFSLGPGTMATLLVRFAHDLLATGMAAVSGFGLDGKGQRYSVSIAPWVTVTLADLRIRDCELQRILEAHWERNAPAEQWKLSNFWTLCEAAYLLAGKQPRSVHQFQAEELKTDSMAAQVYRALKEATKAGLLAFEDVGLVNGQATYPLRRVSQADALAWGAASGLAIPESLRGLQGTCTSGASVTDAAAAPAGAQSSAPLLVAASDLAAALEGCTWNRTRDGSIGAWERRLSDPSKWMAGARKERGAPGIAPSLWDPVELAAALVARGVPADSLARRFDRNPCLRPWAERWGETAESLANYGLSRPS